MANKKSSKKIAVKPVQKTLVVQGRTTRAAMINTLLKNKGKVVTVSAIKEEVKRLKKQKQDGSILALIKIRAKSVAKWAGQHDFKFVAVSGGYKLVAV